MMHLITRCLTPWGGAFVHKLTVSLIFINSVPEYGTNIPLQNVYYSRTKVHGVNVITTVYSWTQS
jgi:hypothetical protein